MTTKLHSHWILIRGLAREARHWGDFASQFKAELENDGQTETRVDAIDLPGAGCFSEMRSPISVPEITDFMREKFLEIRHVQRQAAESPERTFLVALSLGGMVASQWMESYPRDMSGCVLINTSFKGFSPLRQRLMPSALRHFFGILRSHGDAVKSERHVLEMVSNRPELRDKISKEWAAYQLGRPVSMENVMRQLLAASRYQASTTEPKVPVLLLNSLQDRMVSPSCSQAIARRWPRAELRLHPNAGHDLPLDDAEWTIKQIVSWYRGLGV